jgi:hypothetical protein
MLMVEKYIMLEDVYAFVNIRVPPFLLRGLEFFLYLEQMHVRDF